MRKHSPECGDSVTARAQTCVPTVSVEFRVGHWWHSIFKYLRQELPGVGLWIFRYLFRSAFGYQLTAFIAAVGAEVDYVVRRFYQFEVVFYN